jgi:hypothetical protein
VKTLRPVLLVVAVSLGLAACDYRDETHVTPPQASAPDDTPRVGPATSTAAAPVTEQPAVPATASVTPAEPPETTTDAAASDANATRPTADATAAAPATNAMGAQPANMPAAAPAADGSAAPTELARFLEENPIKQKGS